MRTKIKKVLEEVAEIIAHVNASHLTPQNIEKIAKTWASRCTCGAKMLNVDCGMDIYEETESAWICPKCGRLETVKRLGAELVVSVLEGCGHDAKKEMSD